MAETETLVTKYRPTKWFQVIGQVEVVASLKHAIQKELSHCLLFTGPSGTGKTTLARIALAEVGAKPAHIHDFDAATLTGIDDIRDLKQTVRYRPIGGTVKAIIVDECHGLSKAAWNALLKELEEARDYLYWAFCTTQPQSVPQTMRTRSTAYSLKPVSANDLIDLLDEIADQENFACSGKVISLCAKEAGGSPRQAISNLAVCADVKDREEAAKLLRSAEASTEAHELARMLCKRGDWPDIRPLLVGLAEVNPESVRHIVLDYTAKVMIDQRKGIDAGYYWRILDAFATPFFNASGMAPVLHAIGKVIGFNLADDGAPF